MTSVFAIDDRSKKIHALFIITLLRRGRNLQYLLPQGAKLLDVY